MNDTVALFRQDPSVGTVTVHVEASDAVITADPHHVTLVLLNLLMNGAQAMLGEGEISISTHTNGASCDIRVTDRGPGIPPEVREHLFEPFFTTRHTGTGLGLVTARRLMEAQGGTVLLECPPAGGTVATVRVPKG